MKQQRDEEYLRFDQYYREHWRRLCTIARIKLGDADFAEEIAEETFLTAWVKRKEFLASPHPVGWLYKTLNNKILNAYEGKKRLHQWLEEKDMAEMGCCDTLDPRLTFQGMVSDEELSLLYNRYVREMPYQELASELQIELSACKMRVKRARERFSKAYIEEIGE